MRVTAVGLRRRTREIFEALERGEEVTLLYRGEKKGVIVPATNRRRKQRPMSEHPAVGMWKDREDMKDVNAFVRKLRRGRFDDL